MGAPQAKRSLPMTSTEFREVLWTRAGVDLDTRAAALKEAFETSRALLKAEKVELVSFQGCYQEVSVPDNAARARAVDQMFAISGVEVSRNEGGKGPTGPIHITINAPWFQPDVPVDVTPPTVARELEEQVPRILEQEQNGSR